MNNSNQEVLTQNGVDKISFYWESTPIINNAFTACLFINSEKNRIEARGISICSLRDTFNRKKGKSRAYGRAMKALTRKVNDYKINPIGREDEFVKRSMKIKNEVSDKEFLDIKAKELMRIDPNMELTITEINSKNLIKKYTFDLPVNYPILIANQSLRFKSHYRPNPTGKVELDILNKTQISNKD